MLPFPGRGRRALSAVSVVGIAVLAAGCLQEPQPNYRYQSLDAAGEVFRVFCRRVARAAHPQDPSGDQYVAMCDGADADKPIMPAANEDTMLTTLIGRRPQVVAALRQTFSETSPQGVAPIDGTLMFGDAELSHFLSSLVPFYDKPEERIPNSTRDIAAMLNKVIDPSDPRASAAIDTAARLSARVGYRPSTLVLGAVRPILSYEGLDDLANKLLPVVAEKGSAHDQWVEVLKAAALELADDPVKVDPATSTLKVALDLLFKTDDTLAGPSGELPVLQRDSMTGDAQPSADGAALSSLPTPFKIPDRDDMGQARDSTGAAIASNGNRLFNTFDANKTILAAGMREASKLIDRGTADRSGLENMAHGIKPLLGPYGPRTFKIGQNNFSFTGPDLDNSPLMSFVYALTSIAQYPETQDAIELVRQLLLMNESVATSVLYGGLAINDRGKKHPEAVLTSPNDFWDDLIDQAQNGIVTLRPGLLQALIESFTTDIAPDQGPLFADWMTHNDVVTYQGAPLPIDGTKPYTDAQKMQINAPVTTPLMSMVDRSMPDTSMNRSIWQRTMSLIAGLNGVQVCNKQGAILNVPTSLGLFTFPVGNAAGYDKCAFIEFDDAVEVYAQALLGKAKVTLKDDIASGLAALGAGIGVVGSVADITEQNSQLNGFRDTLTPQSMARFIFAPPNKFIKDLFDPLLTNDGVPIKDYEPYALFPMEDPDANANMHSFIDLTKPSAMGLAPTLVQAFDDHELRDSNGKLTNGYMFGNLLAAVHKHWASKQDGMCAAPIVPGNEGCVQSSDPTAKFYSAGSNVQSYEALIAEAFKDENFLGILHDAAVVVKGMTVNNKSGTQVLANFVQRMLTPDPMLMNRAGKAYTKTNTCVETVGMDGKPACANNLGRIIPQYTPLYLVLDALHEFDDTWAQPTNKDRHDAWLAGRSQVVDTLLTVTRSGAPGSYTYKLADRNAYAIANTALPWIQDQINAHQSDLVSWSEGLAGRLANNVLKHPLAAGLVDLLDAFWPEADASGEFTKVAAAVLNENDNPDHFRGMLVSAADLLNLVHNDQNLSPAIQFASLGLATNAFDAVSGNVDPDVADSTIYAGLELVKDVVQQGVMDKGSSQYTTLYKLLHNFVISDGTARSPLEVVYDATADVNRIDTSAPTEQPLSSDEDRQVLTNVSKFLQDDSQEQKSLERLYQVIQARTLTSK